MADGSAKILDCLDFFITNGFAPSYLDIESNEHISSDHITVIATVYSSIQEKPKIVRLTKNKTDWNYSRELLKNNIDLKLLLKDKLVLEDNANFYYTDSESLLRSNPTGKTKIKENALPYQH